MKRVYKFKISKVSHVFLIIFFLTLYVAAIFSFNLAGISEKLLVKAQNEISDQEEVIPLFEENNATASTQVEPQSSIGSWGIARQVDENTWTMQVGNDKNMATPDEVFAALNNYRKQHGSTVLVWDQNLADFAKKRVTTFISIKGLDNHTGFNEYFKNSDNIRNLGFQALGENSSYGYKMAGVHLVEWVFAGDAPHNDNQLDRTWSHVGISVSGTAVDVIFGKK